MAQKTPVTLGSVAAGSAVPLNVDGAPREWVVVHRGKPSSIYSSTFTGGTILMMKDIYEERAWHSSNTNDYANSTIHAYLNSTFLAKLDADVRSAVKQVKIPYRPGSGAGTTISSGESGLAAKVWLPSGYEVGLTTADHQYFPADGAKFSYFLSGTAANALSKRLAYLNGTAAYWWLRSPYCHPTLGATDACGVSANGEWSGSSCSISRGIRPCLVLPDSFVLSEPVTLTDLQGSPLSIQAEQVSGAAQIVTGSYTGTGTASRTISLGFTPSAVLISQYGSFADSGTNSAITNTCGLALIGLPAYADKDSPADACKTCEIVDNGFKVFYSTSGKQSTNENAKKYYYVAIG